MGKSSLNNTMSDKQFWPNIISWCLKPFCNRLYSHDNKIIYDNNNIKKIIIKIILITSLNEVINTSHLQKLK